MSTYEPESSHLESGASGMPPLPPQGPDVVPPPFETERIVESPAPPLSSVTTEETDLEECVEAELILPPRTSIFAAVAGGAVVILTILALAGTGGPNLLGVTLIVLGAAFVSAGLQTLRRLIAVMQFSEDCGLRTPAVPGISAEVLAGGVGIVLGLLALVFGNTSLMASIAALVFGSVVVLQNLACQLQRCGTGGGQIDFGGVKLLIALAVIVLAILGLVGIAQYTMALVALLLLGIATMVGACDRSE